MAYSEIVKLKIIERHAKGEGYKRIAHALGISVTGVRNFIKNYQKRQSINRKPETGPSNVLDTRTERSLLRTMDINPLMSTRELSSKYGISQTTTYKTSKKHNFRFFNRAPRFRISEINLKKRRQWATKHISWTVEDWERVIFSDEVMVMTNLNRGRCWSRSMNPQIFTEVTNTQFPSKQMFWGYITANGVGTLVPIEGTLTMEKYKNVLEKSLIPKLPDRKFLLQHDNATVHTAVGPWLEDLNIEVLDWPAQSPDINPIENIWGIIKKKLGKNPLVPKDSNEDLIPLVLQAWHEIQGMTISKLYSSLPRRIRAIIDSHGRPIKY